MKSLKIYLQILFIKFRYPAYLLLPASLVYAQAWHETGGFKSAVFKENNNLFGMKRSTVRNYDTGTNRGHATFKSLSDNIKDYYERQLQFKIPYKNVNQYIADTNDSGYAEDPKYVIKWQTIYQKKKYLSYISYLFIPSVITLFILIRSSLK